MNRPLAVMAAIIVLGILVLGYWFFGTHSEALWGTLGLVGCNLSRRLPDPVRYRVVAHMNRPLAHLLRRIARQFIAWSNRLDRPSLDEAIRQGCTLVTEHSTDLGATWKPGPPPPQTLNGPKLDLPLLPDPLKRPVILTVEHHDGIWRLSGTTRPIYSWRDNSWHSSFNGGATWHNLESTYMYAVAGDNWERVPATAIDADMRSWLGARLYEQGAAFDRPQR